jgi:ubiquinone/menaquinone biosynthesis C-methylase UbiE
MNEASSSEVRRLGSNPEVASVNTARRSRWVPETKFGQWFIGTRIWERYVVEESMRAFVRLLSRRRLTLGRVLDAGCGPGVSLPLLERYFEPAEIVGLDIDPGEIERARAQVRRCSCAVELVQGDIAQLDFADSSFDLILCHQTLHHVVDQAAVLREFHRVLAPGGALLIAESCREFILSTPVRVLFRHPNEVQKTAGEYQRLLLDAGFSFTPAEMETSRPFWSLLDWGLRERLGWRPKRDPEPTQMTAVAFKPAA